MHMPIVFCNTDNKSYQQKLNKLLSKIFFDFSFWYDLNLWDERYESYAIVTDDENESIVSNLCVFKTQLLWRGHLRDALSIGAVCTDPRHRGKGYARRLMEFVIQKYPGSPMYLSANEDVLDFYPRFGFRRVQEKLPSLSWVIENSSPPAKLSYNDPRVADYVRERKPNSSLLDSVNADSVTLFHIHLGPYKDFLYEIPKCSALAVASQDGATLRLHGLFA